MSSSVYFKFKSQKEPSRISFDGTGISVFELKRDIIVQSGLGDGTEFDLKIFSEDLSEEYDDDTTIIPRAALVIARRLPPLKPGAGRAARYMTGKAPTNAKNSRRTETATPATKGGMAKPAGNSSATTMMTAAMTEEEKMAAMFAQQNEQWNATQLEMANQTPVFNSKPGHKKLPQNVPDHEPPTGYICYRCGEKGHWIQVCPTNEDPTFDNKPRVKRTTGIPRSFLKTVEKPTSHVNDGTMDDTKAQAVMVNAEGEFVVAEPDSRAWEKFQEQSKNVAAQQKASDSSDQEWKERGLECPIDKRMFVDPMKTPCCETTYCNDCITNALIESDFTCPSCGKDEVFIDNLVQDAQAIDKIKLYQDEMSERKDKARSKSPSASPKKARSESPPVKTEGASTTTEVASSIPPTTTAAIKRETTPSSKQPSPAPSTTTSITSPSLSKKRPAEDPLPDNACKVPKGPKAMQTAQAPFNNPMAAFPGMPDMATLNAMNMGMMPGFPMNPMMNPMLNPMMGQFPMQQFPNMNMYGNMNGMNGMNGFNMGGGMPNMPNPFMNGMNGMPNMNGMPGIYNNNNNNMIPQQNTRPNPPQNNMRNGQFQKFNQQRGPMMQNGGAEEGPYMRNPINPHRAQGGRNKGVRPSEYTELQSK